MELGSDEDESVQVGGWELSVVSGLVLSNTVAFENIVSLPLSTWLSTSTLPSVRIVWYWIHLFTYLPLLEFSRKHLLLHLMAAEKLKMNIPAETLFITVHNSAIPNDIVSRKQGLYGYGSEIHHKTNFLTMDLLLDNKVRNKFAIIWNDYCFNLTQGQLLLL
jgi:hypothetical protein